MVKSHTTKNSFQTGKLGEKLAREILMKKPRTRDPVPEPSVRYGTSPAPCFALVPGFVTVRGRPKKTAFVVGLEGELGSGKTTFLQGFARGLGIKQKILSPTFIIMRRISIPLFKHPSKAKGGVEEDFFFSTFAFTTRKLGEERMFFE